MSMPHLLLVDIPRSQTRTVEHMLRDSFGYAITHCDEESNEALQLVLQTTVPAIALALVDGTELQKARLRIRALRQAQPTLPILVILVSEAESARDMIKAGATDYMIRPVSSERLRLTLAKAIEMQDLKRRLAYVFEKDENMEIAEASIVGSAAIHYAYSIAAQAAQTRMPLWVEGEEGTGKTTLVRSLHQQTNPFARYVSIDCRNDEVALERALFGDATHPHSLVRAANGTLVLDHLDRLPIKLQAEFAKNWTECSTQNIPWIVATGTTPLKEIPALYNLQLSEGFSQHSIVLPALRYRREDIPVLSQMLLTRHAAREARPARDFTTEARLHLMRAPWPRNMHELSNVLWRAAMQCEETLVDTSHFDALATTPIKATVQNAFAAHLPPWRETKIVRMPVTDADGNIKRIEELEQELIQLALKQYKGHMSEVAKRLGIGRSTLYRKLQDMGSISEPYVGQFRRMS